MSKKVNVFVENIADFGNAALEEFGCGAVKGIHYAGRLTASIVYLVVAAVLFAFVANRFDAYEKTCGSFEQTETRNPLESSAPLLLNPSSKESQ